MTSAQSALGALRARTWPSVGPWLGRGLASAAVGLTVGFLVASGSWYLALALLLAVPVFVVLHRYPLISITVWLIAAPLVAVAADVGNRRVYWVVHRGLPVLTLIAIAGGAILGLSERKLARLGWAELMMAGYVVATLLSILYTSGDPLATTYLLYDRTVIPMCLYLIVRLAPPEERDLRRLMPAAAFLLLTQSLIGVLSWAAPGMLPAAWLVHEGQRTTGSLRDPNVFAVSVLFAGLVLLYGGLRSRVRSIRFAGIVLFVLSLVVVFFTFSRGVWLAGLVVTLFVIVAYPRFARRFTAAVVPLILLVLASGAIAPSLHFADERLLSSETALSRLPVYVAAVRMFEVKPLTGWGYENWDRYSRPFQGRVGNLASAAKPHASHNLYLTLIAEQGLIGVVLFLGPLVFWLVLTVERWRSIPRSGGIDRRLLLLLWAEVAAFLVMNNFVVVHVTFGPGVYWLTLGIIGSVVSRFPRAPRPAEAAA